MSNTARLQQALGYEFADPQLLDLALTHCSAGKRNNERLEFLGDSIINHIVTDTIFRQAPSASEGDMTRMRASLVRQETLAEVATELQLGEHIRLGPGERKSGGHRRDSILADALEAVAGAILLDSGMEQCQRSVHRWFGRRLQELSTDAVAKDAKTRLQEFLQGRSFPLPEYDLISVRGQDHDQLFHVACRLQQPQMVVEADGPSRRKAEQNAANAALARLSEHGR
jgi:ribonuclease-3